MIRRRESLAARSYGLRDCGGCSFVVVVLTLWILRVSALSLVLDFCRVMERHDTGSLRFAFGVAPFLLARAVWKWKCGMWRVVCGVCERSLKNKRGQRASKRRRGGVRFLVFSLDRARASTA